MRSGKTILNHSQFWGYTKGSDGVLVIVPKEAEIVHKFPTCIYRGMVYEKSSDIWRSMR